MAAAQLRVNCFHIRLIVLSETTNVSIAALLNVGEFIFIFESFSMANLPFQPCG